MNFDIKKPVFHKQLDFTKNLQAYILSLFSLTILQTIKEYNKEEELKNSNDLENSDNEFRAVINGGVALKAYFPFEEEFVTSDYDLLIFSPNHHVKNQKNINLYHDKQLKLALMLLKNCNMTFFHLVKRGIFEEIKNNSLQKEFILTQFPKAKIIFQNEAPFSCPFIKNFRENYKEPMYTDINYKFEFEGNKKEVFSGTESMIEIVGFLNIRDITGLEPDFSAKSLENFYNDKWKNKPVKKGDFYMNFKNPAGRKGFYKQYFYTASLEPYIYIASLGYIIWDITNALNRYFDAVSNIQNKNHNYKAIVGTLLQDDKYPYDGKNPLSSHRFKYERYLRKHSLIVKLLSDEKYLNHYNVKGMMDAHKEFNKKYNHGIEGCALDIEVNGEIKLGQTQDLEELVEIIIRSGIFPPQEKMREILKSFSFETLCSYVKETLKISDE